MKAYRDPVGVWTIGSGLTAASGVIKPKAGMTISRDQARDLLASALRRNYEPAVEKAMPAARQNEFDGAVSFHFNTGAIGRASWVKAWKNGAKAAVIRAGLGQWKKGGGKVLPGLVRRRDEEADIILIDRWPSDLNAPDMTAASRRYAILVVSLSVEEIAAIREGLRTVGFDPGNEAAGILRAPVEAFQKTYGLTVDGKIGRATLSTLQRELDARSAAKKGTGGVVVGGGGAAGTEAIAPDPTGAPDISGLPADAVFWTGTGIAVLAALYLAWRAWHYRDMIAARIQTRTPRLAAWLRSF
ncbi:MAG: glycoside hydrolase family protein [Rhizobiaceae bacterium]|nr:glycoside hydrolase family protein [Rhizobiaceae bacterium]